jgi:hypothetical protein
MPKVRLSQKTKLQLYQREFEGEVITTENKILYCRASEKTVGCEKRFQVLQHLNTNIHYLIEYIPTSLCSSKLKPRCHYDHTFWYERRQKVLCCSLLNSTSSMGRSAGLSDFERGLVIGCHISKKSVRDIATLLKLPKSAVSDVIVK